MDKQSRPLHESEANSLEKDRAGRLGRRVRQLEDHLQSHWFDTKKTKKLLHKIQRDIGEDAIDKKASLLAVGHTYDASGYVDPNPVAVASEDAYFKGVKIQQINGDDRVSLQYEVHDTQDDAAMWPYSILPSAVLYNEVNASYQHQAFEYIANSRTFAKKMFESFDFFHLNPEQQHTLLRKQVAEEMLADFGAEYDEDTSVAIGCKYYYQLDYEDTSVEDWNKHRHEGGVLEGSIIDAVYLESLQDNLPHLANKQDFIYGRGLPCLVVTNDERSTISYVPATAITTFSSLDEVG